MKPTIPLDYVAEVLNESGKRFYISEYIWSKHGGDCKYRKGEETYEKDAKKFVHEKFSKFNWWHNKHSNFWTFVDGTNEETFEIEWNKITIDVKIIHFGYIVQANGGSHHHCYEYKARGNQVEFVKQKNGLYHAVDTIPLPTTSTGYRSAHVIRRDASKYIKANELRDYILSELGEPPAQGDLFS
tara:strand:+ start:1249 stop:1803 length:555 start_codon:yes stop_codon:yes gene_type:complete